jgi:DNA mismatch endonuclease (patch repair protein)
VWFGLSFVERVAERDFRALMTDKVDADTRSRIMSRIRSKDTTPEMVVREGLFARGFRYRLHRHDLPGRPDLIFPRYRAVIMVHGCFWHGHGCKLAHKPLSNTDYWDSKIERNRRNGARARIELENIGWRVMVIWECEVRKRNEEEIAARLDGVSAWIREGAAIFKAGS